MFFASFGVLPFGIGAVQQRAFRDISGSVWIWAAYIVLFPTIVTYLLNLWALKRASSNIPCAP
jgi:drug/metabolite transporter (DMT)-like permease